MWTVILSAPVTDLLFIILSVCLCTSDNHTLCPMFSRLTAFRHQGSESAAHDLSGHAGLQQEEGDGQCQL